MSIGELSNLDPWLIYAIIASVLIAFLIIWMMKGAIKMILLGGSVLCAIFTYFWVSKNGFTYLSFITKDPEEWMVVASSWISALLVLAVLSNGLFWFSNIFSWSRNGVFGGFKGALTTILMGCVIVWVGLMLLFYYGSVAEMTRSRELALYHMDTSKVVSVPWAYKWKHSLSDNPATSWLSSLCPEHDPERLALSKVVVYLCTLDPTTSAARRRQIDYYMPKSRQTSRVLSLKVLSEDETIRTSVQKGDMQGLYSHVKLTKYLQDDEVREVFKKLDVDTILGFKFTRSNKPQATSQVSNTH